MQTGQAVHYNAVLKIKHSEVFTVGPQWGRLRHTGGKLKDGQKKKRTLTAGIWRGQNVSLRVLWSASRCALTLVGMLWRFLLLSDSRLHSTERGEEKGKWKEEGCDRVGSKWRDGEAHSGKLAGPLRVGARRERLQRRLMSLSMQQYLHQLNISWNISGLDGSLDRMELCRAQGNTTDSLHELFCRRFSSSPL